MTCWNYEEIRGAFWVSSCHESSLPALQKTALASNYFYRGHPQNFACCFGF